MNADRHRFRWLIFTLALLLAQVAQAQTDVETLLAREAAPAGVVFEVIEEDEYALAGVFPEVRRQAERLRKRFPGLPIAVVTHGLEQFGLLSVEASGLFGFIHDQARDLTDAEVDLHVCEVHASWHGHAPEDFPSYVDVAASGPALVNDYRALGYAVIRLAHPEP